MAAGVRGVAGLVAEMMEEWGGCRDCGKGGGGEGEGFGGGAQASCEGGEPGGGADWSGQRRGWRR